MDYNTFYWLKATVYLFTSSTLYKKIASNTLAQIISKVLTAGISIFLIGILTKYLPIEMYGNYNKIYSYLGIFAFLADLGLYTIAIREISRGVENKEKIIANVLTLRVSLGIMIWILSLVIALFLPGYGDKLTLVAIFIVGAFTLVSLINSSLLALMQSQMKMEFSLISVVAGKIVNISLIAFSLIYIFSGEDMKSIAFLSVFIAGFLGICLNTYMNYLYAQKICSIRFGFDKEYISHIFKISLPYGVALFLSVVYFKIDIILLSVLESPDMSNISIALYGLPMKIVEVLMVLGGFYLNSILPSLSEKFRTGDTSGISSILGISLKVLLSFSLCLFILGSSLSRDIISLIATPEYLNPSFHDFDSAFALSLALGVLVFHFISLAFIYVFIASERQSLLLKINIVVSIVNVIGNILLIPYYSFIGAAIITLVSQALLMSICACIVMREIKIESRFYASFSLSLLIGLGVFLGLEFILDNFSLSSGGNIFLYGTAAMFIYFFGEYVASKKLFKLL